MTEERDEAEEAADQTERDPDAAPAAESDPGDDDEFPDVDQLLGTFMAESSLWPVLIVALGSGGAFGAALLVLTAVDRNPFAAAALLLVLGMTIDITLRARREPGMRNVARFIGLLWGASMAFAALALWTGIATG